MVVDMHTGRILHSANADRAVYPASLTKLMTVYLIFEAMERKRLGWGTRIPVSSEAASRPPSKLGVRAGQSITVSDAVRALIVKSANDVAAAVAEHLGGSEAGFARLMTAKARDMGMKATTFRNASGLPNHQQVTTARDMIRLAQRLHDDFPQHYRLFRLRRFVYNGRVYRSHNGLLGRFPGTEGMKTGYIRASGFNLVAAVRRNRRHVVGVVFGGRTAGRRNAKMRRILRTALRRASPTRSILRGKPQLVAERRPPAAKRVREAPAAALTTVELRRRRLEAAARQSVQAEPPPAPVRRVRQEPEVHVARVRRIDIRSHRRQYAGNTDVNTPDRTARSPASEGASRSLGRRPVARPPSTLNAQARLLAQTGRAPRQVPTPADLRPGQPPASWNTPRSALGGTPDSQNYAIQVGAYASKALAENRLAQVRAVMRGALSDVQPLAMPVQSGQRKIYRARFIGFDAENATQTCTRMRRQSIDCYVAKGS